jgi:hypothetical protein
MGESVKWPLLLSHAGCGARSYLLLTGPTEPCQQPLGCSSWPCGSLPMGCHTTASGVSLL